DSLRPGTDPGATKRTGKFDNKTSAINAIFGSTLDYCERMRDVGNDLHDALGEPPPPKHPDLADVILSAALDATIEGAVAGVAMHFARRAVAEGHEASIEAVKTTIEGLGNRAFDRGDGEPASGGEPAPRRDVAVILSDPRNAFISQHADRITAL